MLGSDSILREYRTTLAMIEMGEVDKNAGIDDARWLCREMAHHLACGWEISLALRSYFAEALTAIGNGADPAEELHLVRARGRPGDAFRQRMAWLYFEARKAEGAEDPTADAMREFRYADGLDAFENAMHQARQQHQITTPDCQADGPERTVTARLDAGYAEAIARLSHPGRICKGKK